MNFKINLTDEQKDRMKQLSPFDEAIKVAKTKEDNALLKAYQREKETKVNTLTPEERRKAIDIVENKEAKSLVQNANNQFYKGVVGLGEGLSPVKIGAVEKANEMAGGTLKDSNGYTVGNVLGTMTQFAAPYSLGSGVVAKGVAKVLPNASKLGKIAATSAATDLAIGLPLNVSNAMVKRDLRGEEAAEDIALNTSLDLLTGELVEVFRLFKPLLKGKKTSTGKILNTAEDVANLTDAEKREVVENLTDAERMEIYNATMPKNTAEEAVAYNNNNTWARYNAERTQELADAANARKGKNKTAQDVVPGTDADYPNYSGQRQLTENPTIYNYDAESFANERGLPAPAKVNREYNVKRRSLNALKQAKVDKEFQQKVDEIADYMYNYKPVEYQRGYAMEVSSDARNATNGTVYKRVGASSNSDPWYKKYGKQSKKSSKELAEKLLYEDNVTRPLRGDTYGEFYDEELSNMLIKSESTSYADRARYDREAVADTPFDVKRGDVDSDEAYESINGYEKVVDTRKSDIKKTAQANRVAPELPTRNREVPRTVTRSELSKDNPNFVANENRTISAPKKASDTTLPKAEKPRSKVDESPSVDIAKEVKSNPYLLDELKVSDKEYDDIVKAIDDDEPYMISKEKYDKITEKTPAKKEKKTPPEAKKPPKAKKTAEEENATQPKSDTFITIGDLEDEAKRRKRIRERDGKKYFGNIEVVDKPPEGFVKFDMPNAPKGYSGYSNNKSYFGGERITVLVKDKPTNEFDVTDGEILFFGDSKNINDYSIGDVHIEPDGTPYYRFFESERQAKKYGDNLRGFGYDVREFKAGDNIKKIVEDAKAKEKVDREARILRATDSKTLDEANAKRAEAIALEEQRIASMETRKKPVRKQGIKVTGKYSELEYPEGLKGIKSKPEAVANRIFKISEKNNYNALNGAFMRDGKQYIFNHYYGVVLDNPIRGLKEAEGNDTIKSFVERAERDAGELVETPTLAQLKSIIDNAKKDKKETPLYGFPNTKVQVNAQYLNDILQLIPDAKIRLGARNVDALFVEGANGKAILLPVRNSEKARFKTEKAKPLKRANGSELPNVSGNNPLGETGVGANSNNLYPRMLEAQSEKPPRLGNKSVYKSKGFNKGKLPEKVEGETVTEKSINAYNEMYGTKKGSNLPENAGFGENTQGIVTLEKGLKTAEGKEVLNESIISGDVAKFTQTNNVTVERADKILKDNSLEEAKEIFTKQVENPTTETIALGARLIQSLEQIGDREGLQRVIADYLDVLSETGRRLQASQILGKLTPEGRLVAISRAYKNASKRLNKEVTMSKEVMDAILNASTPTEKMKAQRDAFLEIWEQTPPTFSEKMNVWRYSAMLLNPLTHVRNVLGNVLMKIPRGIKNTLAEGIETIKGIEKTKSFKGRHDKELVDMGAKDFDDFAQYIYSDSNKFNEGYRPMESEVFTKVKIFEKIRKITFNSLEAEDKLFAKSTYKRAFAEYLYLHGGKDASSTVIDNARQYALAEAKNATFRDTNELATAIAKTKMNLARGDIKKRAAGWVLEGAIPFAKTPVNILKAGLEYSPANLINNLIDIPRVKKGEITVNQAIDSLAKTLTGSGLVLSGYFLAKGGYLNGGMEYDKEGKYKSDLGIQEYALQFDDGGKSYSIDWAVPSAMPLLAGAEIFKLIDGTAELTDIIDGLSKITDPFVETSMMQGIEEALKTSAYAGSNALLAIPESLANSYISQYIPSLAGTISRISDDTRRITKSTSDSAQGKMAEQFINKSFVNKFNSKSLEPYIDVWGREQSRGELGERIIQNTLSAGFYKRRELTSADREILRLSKKLGDDEKIKVIPATSTTYEYAYDDKTYRMSEKDLTKFNRTAGKYRYSELNKLFASDNYKSLSDSDKAKAIESVYEEATSLAKADFLVSKGVKPSDAYFENKTMAEGYEDVKNTYTEREWRIKYKEITSQAKIEGGASDATLSIYLAKQNEKPKIYDAFGIENKEEDAKYLVKKGYTEQDILDYKEWLKKKGLNLSIKTIDAYYEGATNEEKTSLYYVLGAKHKK